MLCIPTLIFSQSRVLGPYLQDATVNSIVIMWETTNSTDSKVSYGLTTALGSEATGSSVTGFLLTKVHNVKVEGLQPDTKYYYSVNYGNKYSDTIPFLTPPLQSAEKSFGMIAFSDMQRDATKPNKFLEVVEDGVLDYMETISGNSIPDKLAYILVPGDLVAISTEFPTNTYDVEFFEPGKNLFEMVPVYPVLGNHEYIGFSAPFFKYFDLPKNGTDGFFEHWWYKDYSNTRIVGLQSNLNDIQSNNGVQKQLDWLQGVLDDACADPAIDFVFAQIHHPYHSEMWGPGELNYTGDVIEKLENFSSSCEKPSIHFFGHTHSYGRGQSKDHKHLMVNVASAGGALDRWGDGDDTDYEEYSKGISDYGFVYLEVEAGDEPKFTLKRISRGNVATPLDNEVVDSIVIYKNNLNPNIPTPIKPIDAEVNPACVVLEAGLFSSGAAGTLHGESQWQVASACDGFDNPLVDIWKNYENIAFNEDRQAGDDITDQEINGLNANSSYCWRVRYRDRNLRWSAWTDPVSFTTGNPLNLLRNPGAEFGTQDWTVASGALESLASGECDGDSPYEGSRYFVVGAACDQNDNAEAFQVVDVSAYATSIDAGNENVYYGGYLSDFIGFDLPQFRIAFLDENDVQLDQTAKSGGRHSNWRTYDKEATIPVNTRKIKFKLFGTKGLFGSANDCYFDELYLVVDSTAGRIDTTICAGETITVFGEEFSTPGTYLVTDENSDDCLNEYTLNVVLSDTSSINVEELICPGDSVQVGDQYFSEGGLYEVILTNSVGCDSTVVLNLIILLASDAGCTVGINDHLIENLVEFYPNPFTNEAILKLKYLPESNLELKVFNDIGALVDVYTHITSDEIKIHRGELASGVYFYTLGKQDNVYAKGNFMIAD